MRILHAVGARPNFMKVAPVIQAMARHGGFHSTLVHTGQHYDDAMSATFLTDLDLPTPHANLSAGAGTHAGQTATVMERFEPVLSELAPDLVMVVGDVNSTLACALVAAKLGIPLAHVEAGVRSLEKDMPEEINRVLTDALADLLFTPSPDASQHLRREGIPADRIHFVGNVMTDALLPAMRKARRRRPWQRWLLEPQGFGVVTLHRPPNVDDPERFAGLLAIICEVAGELPLLFPAHPRTHARLRDPQLASVLGEAPELRIVEPLGYLEFIGLLSEAKFVLTDSGGIQTEATILGTPCLTLRDTTEWPLTISHGTNRLVGADRARVLGACREILASPRPRPRRPRRWDGRAAERIVRVIVRTFGLP